KLRAMKNKRVRKYAECWKHFKAGVRAKVEHPFRVVKRQFGCTRSNRGQAVASTLKSKLQGASIRPSLSMTHPLYSSCSSRQMRMSALRSLGDNFVILAGGR